MGPQERPFEIAATQPPSQWPSNGQIIFDNVWMRYREGLEYVLKGLTFEVRGGEKVGVIGRTGAGKSSLFVTLLRLVELEPFVMNEKSRKDEECQIIIDDIDISTIGLRDLRSKLSVIPQDPVLFTGSVRFNLDPFEEKADDELIHALKLSHCYEAMKKMIIEVTVKKERDEQQKKEKEEKEKKKNKKADQSMSQINVAQLMENPKYRDLNPLDIVVEENGSNFSVGQRQLLCLARAIVRGSKILLLDEATSAVDPQTDQLIQQTIREVFKTNTILTIAHRIDTILDYDKILIMDNGSVLEYDKPDSLLSNKSSRFSEIVQESFGVNLEEVLKKKLKIHKEDETTIEENDDEQSDKLRG